MDCADRVALPWCAAVKQLPNKSNKLDAVNDIIRTDTGHAAVRSIWRHLVKMFRLSIQDDPGSSHCQFPVLRTIHRDKEQKQRDRERERVK